ncbi:hypothetical protein C2E23DRAFT_472179 [Lenzites betulinus]|nr:hypothetical protein C2E23DRAFT_472179 [Lenzites betulinus]
MGSPCPNGCYAVFSDEIDSLSGSCAQLVDASFALTFAAQCRYPSAHIYIFCCHRSWMVSPRPTYSSNRIFSTATDLGAGYNVASCRTSRSFLVHPPAQSWIRAKHQLGMCELRHQCRRSTTHRILSQFSHDSLTCVRTLILRLESLTPIYNFYLLRLARIFDRRDLEEWVRRTRAPQNLGDASGEESLTGLGRPHVPCTGLVVILVSFLKA